MIVSLSLAVHGTGRTGRPSVGDGIHGMLIDSFRGTVPLDGAALAIALAYLV